LSAAFQLQLAGGDVEVAVESRFSEYETCKRRDVVLFGDAGALAAGEVVLHARVFGEHLTAIASFEMLGRDATSARWQSGHPTLLVPTANIRETAIFSRSGNVVTTLLPSTIR
jgi:hypothetical protein